MTIAGTGRAGCRTRPGGRRTTGITGLTVSVVLVAAALGPVGPAAAAPPWLPPQDLAAPVVGGIFSSPGTPALAVGLDGSAVAVVRRFDGTNTVALVVERGPGGAFGAPVTQSAPGADVSSASVATDRQGTTTVAWLRGSQVQTVTRPRGGSWGAAANVAGGGTGQAPQVAVGDNGVAAIAWTGTESGAEERVAVAVRQPGAASFATATFVSPDLATPLDNQIAGRPSIAMSAAGDVAVGWKRDYDPDGSVTRLLVETAVKPAGAGFDPAQARSSNFAPSTAGSGDLALAMTPSGLVMVMWDLTTDASTYVVQYAERSVAATFSAGTWTGATAASTGPSATAPKLALDDSGTAAATWAASSTVQSSVRPKVGQAFASAVPLSGPGANTDTSTVAIAPNGAAVIAWRGVTGSDSTLYSARRFPDEERFRDVTEVVRGSSGTPSVAYQPGPFGASPLQVGLDDQGNGVMTYFKRTTDGSSTTIQAQAVGLDPVAPVLTAVTAPASAVAGTSVAFAASATDRASATTYAWDFGDGGAAAGPAVTHTFAQPGQRTVTVRVTDGSGNVSSRSVQINVTPVTAAPTKATIGGLKLTKAGLRVTLGVAATVSVAASRQTCRPGKPKRCTYAKAKRAKASLAAGTSTLKLKLSGGTYRVRVTAVNAAGATNKKQVLKR